MPFAAFLLAIVSALAFRVLVSMGFGILVFTGWQAIKDDIETLFQTMFTSLPADVYAILAMAGIVDVVGIWLSALTVVVSAFALKKTLLLR